MRQVGIRRDLSLLGLATVVGVFNSPQTKPPRPEYPIVRQIRVDQECRLLLAPAGPDAGAKKAKLVRDPVVCHLESVLSSQHMEESIVGDELHRSRVTIEEQEFVLQNIFGGSCHLYRVSSQPLAEGWTIDSDPSVPSEIAYG